MNEDQRTSESLLANPYAVQAFSPTLATAANQRPGGLTVVGVLCIVGGMVGVLAGLFTLLNVFFGAAVSTAMTPAGPQQQIQQEMNQRVQEIASRYFFANLTNSVVTLAIGIGLLTGGIGIFRNPPWGRSLLRTTLLLAIFGECLKAGIYVMAQLDMMPIMEQFMPRMTTKPGSGVNSSVMGQMMRVMTFVGIGIWLIWSAVKLGLYFWGRAYLKRPKVVDFFDTSTPETPATHPQPDGLS